MGKAKLHLKENKKRRQIYVPSQTKKIYKEGDYQFEDIQDMRIMNGRRLYQIKWRGYGEKDNTWQPIQHLQSIAGEVLKFQIENKQYIQQIENSWRQMFIRGLVKEPLASDELKKLQKLVKMQTKRQKGSRRQEKSKKVKKIPQHNQNDALVSLKIQEKDKSIQEERLPKQRRKYRTRFNYKSKISKNNVFKNNLKISKNNVSENGQQNLHNDVSNNSFSNDFSQILDSAFFQESKHQQAQLAQKKPQIQSEPQLQITPAKPKEFTEENVSTIKKACFPFEQIQNREQPKPQCYERKGSQPLSAPPSKASCFFNQMKLAFKEAKKQSNNEISLKIGVQREEYEKPKQTSLKAYSSLSGPPKKYLNFCNNLPIQRNINKYIYRGKSKNTNHVIEKQKTFLTASLQTPKKQTLAEIIPQKAQDQPSSQNLKKDQLGGNEDMQNGNLDLAFENNLIQQKKGAFLSDHNEPIEAKSQVKEVLIELKPQENGQKQEKQDFFKEKEIQQINGKMLQLQVSLSDEEDGYKTKENKHNKQFNKRQSSLVANAEHFENIKQKSNKLQAHDFFKNQESKEMPSLPQQEGFYPALQQNESCQYLKEVKCQFSRVLEENSLMEPIPKIKKIAKASKSVFDRSFSKKDKRDPGQEKLENYNLNQILQSSISHQELRNRPLKLGKIVRMLKLEENPIFLVLIKEENYLQQRFITYELMKDYYPRPLLKYLQTAGMIQF